MVLLLKNGLGALGARADGLGLVAEKGARRVGVVEVGSSFVDTDDEERDTKGSALCAYCIALF